MKGERRCSRKKLTWGTIAYKRSYRSRREFPEGQTGFGCEKEGLEKKNRGGSSALVAKSGGPTSRGVGRGPVESKK